MSTKLKAGTATSGAVIDADTTGILELQSGSTPTTAVTIDASQNVGIGTTSPSGYKNDTALTVVGASNGAIVVAGASNGSPAVFFRSSATPSTEKGYVQYDNTSNWMRFATDGAERMRIDSSGNLLVGSATSWSGNVRTQITAAAGASSFSCTAASTAAQDQVYFRNPNGIVGTITSTGSSTSYGTSSDYRLKENIAPMTGALDVVQQLKPVTYNWKVDGSTGQGFIAHELQAVVPDCVTGKKDAVDAEGNPVYQGIDTSFLVATLTAAIQELNAKVEAQAAEIVVLKGAK